MTMSERTITVRLTGPQYQAVVAALDLYVTTIDDEGYRRATQRGDVAARASDKIIRAWNRNDLAPVR